MKDDSKIRHDDNIHTAIGRYFDGDLPAREERELLRRLLDHQGDDEDVREALAVMGYTRCAASAAGRKGDRSRWNILGKTGTAAAAVALLAVCATVAVRLTDGRLDSPQDTTCVAYVQGVRIDSEQEVMRLIGEQLGEMGAASEAVSREVTGDLDDIMNALNSEGI